MRPVVSKQFCSKSERMFTVRRRPCVVNGGGFVVSDDSDGSETFRVEGCGKAVKKQALLKDSNANIILSIRKEVGLVNVFLMNKQWKAYATDESQEWQEKVVFKATAASSLAASCAPHRPPLLKISLNEISHNNSWDYEVVGSFEKRQCWVYDSAGNVAAEVNNKTGINASLFRDVYCVCVRPGIDQAFIFGIVAILERLHED